MHNELDWGEIALRLVLTLLGATVIGVNRGEHGRPAGLRTSLLVSLAAAVSMIQANLLLPVAGKAHDSYVVMDLMRLPLGILSGMGFIGAGAILRRDNLVVGVTTAATLWFLTVMGLCFGGGQLALGIVSCALAFIVLRFLKPIEEHWKQDRRGALTIATTKEGPTEEEVTRVIREAGFEITGASVNIEPATDFQEVKCQVQWRGRLHDVHSPPFVRGLAQRKGALKVAWEIQQ